MNELPCGCVYEGPIQVLTCANDEHNVAAKNLNRAQAMLSKVELENEKLRLALKKLIKHRVDRECDCPGGCTAGDEAEALIS